MNFRKIEISDAALFEKLDFSGELSCENAFISLLLWRDIYNHSIAVVDGVVYIRSDFGEGEVYSLPFAEDMNAALIRLWNEEGKDITLWAQEGRRFEEFLSLYAEAYDKITDSDYYDYIYNRNNLAELSGKKYHSKRNHISSFSKKYNWSYEPITEQNRDAVLKCANEWYMQRENQDEELETEKAGIKLLLENISSLPISGGAIFVEDKAVAFTVGAPINNEVFNIYIEKCLSDYAEGYAVINREFAAKALSDFSLINREDDMGIEGLRRAKQSYRPIRLVSKYYLKRNFKNA